MAEGHSGEPLTVEELCRRSGEWADTFRPTVDGRFLQLAEECGEAIQARRRGHTVAERQVFVGEELADIMLVVASLAAWYRVDLTAMIEHKARVHADG